MDKTNWLPPTYSVPKSSGGNYMKFVQGANKIRVMSSPILGFEYWNLEGKPVRLRENPENMPEDMREGDKLKHFWCMVVWNYAAKKIQILEITQSTIQNAITDLALNEDWGSPQDYDLTITKKGEKLETEYSVQPSPHKEVPVEAHKAYHSQTIDLEALFSGQDPFKGERE